MSIKHHLLIAALLLCCLAMYQAFPMEGFSTGQTCRCIRTTSAFVHPRFFRKMEVLPLGAHCRFMEIIITKRDGSTVCINPEAEWIHMYITKLQRSRRQTGEGAAAQR